MYWRVGRSLVLTVLLVGCSATPLTPTGGGGFGVGGKRSTGGTTGGGASDGTGTIAGGGGAVGPSGAAASSGGPTGAAASSGGPSGTGGVAGSIGVRGGVGGLAGTPGGYAGFAGAFAGASGTGGTPVDASVPDPWSYRGQRVTKVDVTRCAPYYGCDVCTLTLAGSAQPVVPNLDYALPNPSCYPPPADAGTDASFSLVEHLPVPIAPPPFCAVAAPDGGDSGTITEIVLQPNGDAAPILPSIPNAYCQFLPGPTIAEPHGCLLTTLENDFCVSACLACP
jgi:hypothetical protein